MAQETLNKIKDAELKARQMVKDAQDQKAELLTKAKSEAKKYREDLLDQARTEAAQRLKETEADLEGTLKSAQTRGETVASQLEKNLAGKKEAAVRLVIDSII